MTNEKELKLGAQIISKYISAILNFAANNPNILDPQISTFLQTLEADKLLLGATAERNHNLLVLTQKGFVKGFEPKASGSEIIYSALNGNLGFKKIMLVLKVDEGRHQHRVSTTYNCASGFERDPYIYIPTMACISPSAASTVYDFNDKVYMSALKFLNKLNYNGKTAEEAEELDDMLKTLHAENELWLNTACGGSATAKPKK